MGKRSGETPTPGERVEKWLTNFKTAMALYLMLGGAAIYGNSETVKTLIHEETPIERHEPVPVVSPQLSCPACPKCPDVKLSCPTGVIERHEKEFHAEK